MSLTSYTQMQIRRIDIMKGPINGVMVAESAEKAVFYIFNKAGICTDSIPCNMDDMVKLANGLGASLAKANMKNRTLKKCYYLACITAGVGFGLYNIKRKELKECKEKLARKEMDEFLETAFEEDYE